MVRLVIWDAIVPIMTGGGGGGGGGTRFLSYMIKFDTEQGVKEAPVKYEGLCVDHKYIT